MNPSFTSWEPSRSETPEPTGTLMKKLEEAQFEWVELSNQWIIPNNSLEELVDVQNVHAELIRMSSPRPFKKEVLQRYTRDICKTRKKLFAILVCRWGDRRKCCKTILDLVDGGITDSDLPFDRVHLTDNSPENLHTRRAYKLCKSGHAKCSAASASGHHCLIRALYDWRQGEIDDFLRYQWMVLSPIFRKEAEEIPHYEFEDTILLPFTEDYERTRILTGGYSEVWPVRIYAGHQHIYKPTDLQDKEPMLAIKRLFSSLASEFENETEMLKALKTQGHKNLVELLATYKYRGKYHLLFPYAEFNLRSLWDRMPATQQNPETYLWALDQMTGLASGLVAIHQYQSNMAYNPDIGNPGMTRFRQSVSRNLVLEPGEAKYGRHGDLKPENILWFGEFTETGPSGILQITDFGLGHFHRLESRSRQDPKIIKGSATYTPPEIPLNQPVSRAYDIWSLGCVFLEFVTWLLEGAAGLEEFGQKRMEVAPDGIQDDTFFSLGQGDAAIRGAVREWIEHLHGSPSCSDMVHDLLYLVREKLLVVQPKCRIDSGNLYLELKKMIDKAKRSSEYLTGM